MSVGESWQRIERWLEANAPSLLASLNPPATLDDIRILETNLDVTLSDAVKESYLRHNGESRASDGLFVVWRLLPLADVQARAEELHQISIQYDFDNFDKRSMIPLMEDGGGNLLYTDAIKAADSPVIEWWHEEPSRTIKHSSFKGFLEDFVTDLEAGALILDPDLGLNALVEKYD